MTPTKLAKRQHKGGRAGRTDVLVLMHVACDVSTAESGQVDRRRRPTDGSLFIPFSDDDEIMIIVDGPDDNDLHQQRIVQ